MRELSGLRKRRQSGFVLILMGAVTIVVLGAAGLALDLGRVFIAKQETQAYADAAATAAALELDGTTAGFTRARTAAAGVGNTWNLNSQSVPSPTVEFATAAAGPWVASPAAGTGYIAARVTATVSNSLWFMPLVAHRNSTSVVSHAVAIQQQITGFSQGLAPYSAVAQSTTGPKFGMVVGNSYTIQWPQFSGGNNCKQNTPDKCFGKPPCAGDSKAVEWAVASNWGSANSGYWGFSANSDIEAAILDGLQTRPVAVGDNIEPVLSNGQKQAQAGYLDERAGQDGSNSSSNNLTNYLADMSHNGRRLLTVPVVLPTSTTQTSVYGFGTFLLLSNGNSTDYYKKNTNGNDGYCAIYVGPYTLGSNDVGAATSGSGAYQVTLVE